MTAAAPFDDVEGQARFKYVEDELSALKPPDELAIHEELEDDHSLLPRPPLNEKAEPSKRSGLATSLIWMVVNTLATIGIVSARCPPPLLFFSPSSSPLVRLHHASHHI